MGFLAFEAPYKHNKEIILNMLLWTNALFIL